MKNRKVEMKTPSLRRDIFLIVCFFCLGMVPAFLLFGQGGGPETGLTVMTFNIRYDNQNDLQNAWLNRKSLVASTIQFQKIEIAGLQEVLNGQLKDLEGLLPEYAWLGVGRDDGKEGGEYNPIFYLKSKFKILAQSTFWLSETPDTPGSRGWDAACNRIVTWARFEDQANKQAFFFFNTHFDHVGEIARLQSAELVLKKIGEIAGNEPVMVTGDFNCRSDDAPYHLLISGDGKAPGLVDTLRLSKTGHYGSTQSFNGFNIELDPGNTIDFIFVRGIKSVLRHGIIAENWDGKFVSDHHPVIAEVVVK
jgi:endonuclease/exonuclease/phosphatase family metal-dependent hydrolase